MGAKEWRPWCAALLAVTVVLFAFLPALQGSFLTWDDGGNFVENRNFRGLGWAELRWAFTTDHLGVYQPLSWLLFSAQFSLWGLDAKAFHGVSLGLYLIDTLLLFYLCRALLLRARPGLTFAPRQDLAVALAVALFAVHPLRTEAVAWLSCQPYLPSVGFVLASLLAYLKATAPQARPAWWAATFVFFVLALLAKAIAVTLPLVLLLLDAHPLGRFHRGQRLRCFIEKLPFLFASALFMGAAMLAKQTVIAPIASAGLLTRLAQAAYGACFYLQKSLWPTHLSAYYSLPDRVDFGQLRYLLCAAMVLAISLAALGFRRRWPALLAAWLTYLIVLLPNSGIMRIAAQLCADRYGYLSTLAAAVLLAGLFTRIQRAVWLLAPAALLVPLFLACRAQCAVWHDSVAMWRNALEEGGVPRPEVFDSLGNALRMVGRLDEAEPHLQRAVNMDPGQPNFLNNLGTLYASRGDHRRAAELFARAIAIQPDQLQALMNLGKSLAMGKQYDPAIAFFQRAAALDPSAAEPHLALGRVLLERGAAREAATEFSLAVQRAPETIEPQVRLGKALKAAGEIAEAQQVFAAVAAHAPSADAHRELGILFAEQGQLDRAGFELSYALRLHPTDPEAHRWLGTVLAGKHLDDEAAFELQQSSVR